MGALITKNFENTQNIAYNILICGIGGQGVVLAGKIISLAAFKNGFDIKTSEVHGMSQRGGSVSSHIRFGGKIFSPLIPKNKASVILSFDIYETLRYISEFANDKTIIISSDYGKMSSWISKNKNDKIKKTAAGIADIAGFLTNNFKRFHLINDKKMAADFGNIKVSNIIPIGLLSNYTDIAVEQWLKAIEENVPEKTVDLNLKAFLAGRKEAGDKKIS